MSGYERPMDKSVLVRVHQLLRNEGLNDTMHRLERETGIYFDRNHVGDLIRNGQFKKAAKYLEGFIIMPSTVQAPQTADQNANHQQISLKIFHDLHLQRYLESIIHHEKYEAFQILQSEMAYMLTHSNFEHYKYLVDLLSTSIIPEDIVKNFVSSRDPTRWKSHANQLFIPQMFKLFDHHPELQKAEQNLSVMTTENERDMILESNGDIDMSLDVIDHHPYNQNHRGQVYLSPERPITSKRNGNNYNMPEYQLLQNRFSNPLARIAISKSGSLLAILDSAGKIYIYKLNLPHFERSGPLHQGFNRGNVLPEPGKISHSICFSDNEQWICSTSGGAFSMYCVKTRRNREVMPYTPNNISYVLFDSNIRNGIIYGLQNGSIEIRANTTTIFQSTEHKGKIICLAKRQSILASVCSEGILSIGRVDKELFVPMHQAKLHGWRGTPQDCSSVSLQFGELNGQPYILIGYSEGILLFDISRGTVVSTTPPPTKTSTFTKVTFSYNYKCVFCCTSENEFLVFATGQVEELRLVCGFELNFSSAPTADIVSHPSESNQMFIVNSKAELIYMTLQLPDILQ